MVILHMKNIPDHVSSNKDITDSRPIETRKLQYSGRGARDFSTSSSSSSSTLKRVWDEQSTFRLFLAFSGGFLGWSYMNVYKRRALTQKIYRMMDEHAKYSEEVWDRYFRFHKGEYDEIPTLDSSNIPTNSGHHL